VGKRARISGVDDNDRSRDTGAGEGDAARPGKIQRGWFVTRSGSTNIRPIATTIAIVT